jgi:hypothetical protein
MVIMTPAEKPRHQAIWGDFDEVSRKITKAPPRPVLLPARQENKNGLQKPGRAGDSIIRLTAVIFYKLQKERGTGPFQRYKGRQVFKAIEYLSFPLHTAARVPFRGIHFFVAPIKLPKSLFNTRSFFCCMIAM